MKSLRQTIQRFAAGAVMAGLAVTAGAGAASAQPHRGAPPPRFERHHDRYAFAWHARRWHRHWIRGHWAFGPYGRRWIPGHWV